MTTGKHVDIPCRNQVSSQFLNDIFKIKDNKIVFIYFVRNVVHIGINAMILIFALSSIINLLLFHQDKWHLY